ncbi:MAG: alpha-rhamnosidase, partial [Sphingobacteriaceae bacterium]
MRFLCAKRIYILIAFTCVISACSQKQPEIKPGTLTCEYLINPLGIDVSNPRLSWNFTSDKRGARQTAYHILVAGSIDELNKNKGDLWDSQKVITDSSLNIVYSGKKPTSGQQFFWKVRIWDWEGEASAWSDPAKWSMGLLNAADWRGQWIGNDGLMPGDTLDAVFTRIPARYVRKEFAVPKQVKRATAYLCGVGLSELYINGDKIGDAVLSPALSEYPKRAWYVTYDVTNNIKQGTNAVGVILGNGRYVGMRVKQIPVYYDNVFIKKLTHYGMPKLQARVDAEYNDGTTNSIYSDTTWKLTNKGPITTNNEFDGEEYDANKELNGWNKPGYNAVGWQQAKAVQPAAKTLSAQMQPPIKVISDIKPVAIYERTPGVYLVDMGQNMVGWIKLKVQGTKGQKVTMRFAEVLKPDSSLNLEPIRTAKVTDIYTLKGTSSETWEPRFTYHGFRYVEVRGYPGKPGKDAITGRVVHDDLEKVGEFKTSNALINQIFSNAYWGMKGNYRSIPTDCPQRDERQGWLGDRATGSRGESYVFNNAPLYAKWLQDIEDAQKPSGSLPDVAPSYWELNTDNVSWPAAYIVIANMLYEQFGDQRSLARHYPSMKKWMLFMKNKHMVNNIITWDQYGDWCVPAESPNLIHSLDPKRKTHGAVISTGFYYNLLNMMERFAKLTGRKADAAEFATLKESVKQAFNAKFMNRATQSYINNTATTNALALHFGLVPMDAREIVFNNMVNTTMNDFKGHVSTGLIGVQFLMRTLTRMGRPDIAYKLTTNKDYPGWGYMVANGATTIWELWNGNTADPFMNSHNHTMLLGDLVIWYFEDLAGIRPHPSANAFKKIIMKPNPVGDLAFVKASHRSPYGLIKSEWHIKDGSFYWDITIPANTSATVYLPATTEKNVHEGSKLAIEAEGVKFIGTEKDRVVYKV